MDRVRFALSDALNMLAPRQMRFNVMQHRSAAQSVSDNKASLELRDHFMRLKRLWRWVDHATLTVSV